MTRFERILVPVDFSPHSKEALDTAIQLAHLFGSTIHLLHCYHIQIGSPGGMVIVPHSSPWTKDAATVKKTVIITHKDAFLNMVDLLSETL